MPGNLTALVDNRHVFGGLKYPDIQLYTVFAIMEKVYSTLSTPSNFMLFGGMLLVRICDAMVQNDDLILLFSDLFSNSEPTFDAQTIVNTLRYYVKVFGNVRAKDLCYRYNSNIQKGARVGTRQMAAGGWNGGQKKGQAEKLNPSAEHESLMQAAEEDLDVDESYEKLCTDPLDDTEEDNLFEQEGGDEK